MKAVWRVALAFFTFVPLQSWLAAIGAMLVAIALVVQLVTLGRFDGFSMLFALLGAVLITMVPGFGGGAVLRHASAMPSLRLRPHGRERVLLGATLAITVIALLAALPFLIGEPGGRTGRAPSPMTVFLVGWSAVALNWIVMFALSGLRWGFSLVWILPVVSLNLPRYLPQAAWPSPPTLFAAGLAAWVLFALWYLRAREFRPAVQWNSGGQQQDGAITGPAAYVRGAAPSSPAQALRQLLNGSAPWITHFLVGAGQALLVLGVFWFVSWQGPPSMRHTMLMSGFFYIGMLITCWHWGYGLVRRVRMLWLRTGMDRAGLFQLAQKQGTTPILLMWAGSLFVILAAQLTLHPEQAQTILACAAVQSMLGTCLFFHGLASTRGWGVQAFFEAVGWFVLGMLAIIFAAPARLAAPGLSPSLPMLSIVFVLLALLAVGMRWRAQRRWLTLDWRVAKLQVMPRALQRSRA